MVTPMQSMYHVGTVTAKIRTEFNVPDSAQCRLWQRHWDNKYQLFTKTNETVSEAGLYGGQVRQEKSVVKLVTYAVTCVLNHTATDA